jgi:hypothetical protein
MVETTVETENSTEGSYILVEGDQWIPTKQSRIEEEAHP